MFSIRPGHFENATGHHHQLKGAPKTPGRQLKSGVLRENAQSVHKIGLGGKQTPFHGKARMSVFASSPPPSRVSFHKIRFTDRRVGLCSLLELILGRML